jgi:hypothetical protein
MGKNLATHTIFITDSSLVHVKWAFSSKSVVYFKSSNLQWGAFLKKTGCSVFHVEKKWTTGAFSKLVAVCFLSKNGSRRTI